MISKEVYFGGARYTAASGPGEFPLKYQTGRVQVINPLTDPINAKLPQANGVSWIKPGGPIFYIVNTGGFDITVVRFITEEIVVVVPPGEIASMWLIFAQSGDGIWVGRSGTYQTA